VTVSNRKRSLSLALALLLAGVANFALLTPAALAEQSTLGGNGVLYTARVGRYGALFPGGAAHPQDTSVLALEVQEKDAAARLILVPGGDGVAPDAVPSVQWEEASRRLFLVWEGLSRIHSGVHLISLRGAEWSEPLEISGSPFTKKSSPQLAVTRETYTGDDGVEIERTVLHTLWFEDDYGDVHVIYAPVVLFNGAVPRLAPALFELGSFVAASEETGEAPSFALLRSPRIVAGPDSQSVLVAFGDDVTDRLVTLRIEALPLEVSALAGELQQYLAGEEADPCKGDVKKLAERARAHLVVIGTRFSAYARSYIADALRDWLLANRGAACGSGGVANLSERARAHLVVIGRRALREVIVSADAAPRSFMLSMSDDEQALHNDLALTVQSSSVAPPSLGAGVTRIHVGGTGRNTLVSWIAAGKLFYQEHDGSKWLPLQSLMLSADFPVETAYSLLDGRAR
jgi:hypothetical protein